MNEINLNNQNEKYYSKLLEYYNQLYKIYSISKLRDVINKINNEKIFFEKNIKNLLLVNNIFEIFNKENKDSEIIYSYYINNLNIVSIYNIRKKINDLKNNTNYKSIFEEIIKKNEFREIVKKMLYSDIFKNYYEDPIYYDEMKNVEYKEKNINDQPFSKIYKDFLNNYIDNGKIYDRIIYKVLPKGVKALVSNYLCFLININDIEEISNINKTDKEESIKSYLLFLISHETNHFAKRTFFQEKEIKVSLSPNRKENIEGGKSLTRCIFGISNLSFINKEMNAIINDTQTWELELVKQKEILGKLKNIYENEDKILKDKNYILKFYIIEKKKKKISDEEWEEMLNNGYGIVIIN